MRTRGRRSDKKAAGDTGSVAGESSSSVAATPTPQDLAEAARDSPSAATTTAVSLQKLETTVAPIEPVIAATNPEETTSSSKDAAAPGAPEATTSASTSTTSSSKIPVPIQFPLVAVLSLAIAAVSHALAYPLVKGVLASYERPLETWTEVALVHGWRIFELALGWFGNYDSFDLAAMSLLSNGPASYLLFSFFELPAPALLMNLVIETVSIFVPFMLLRPLSRAHASPSKAPNAEILADIPIAILTTLLAGVIYSVTLFLAYATILPSLLIAYFSTLVTLEPAHNPTWIGILPVGLALGLSAYVFVFAPAEATERDETDDRNEAFDPVKAGLGETVRWNMWGWTSQTKTAMLRTAVLCLVTGAGTFLQTRLTILGAETIGALAWSSVWVLAGALTGWGLGAVGRP